MTRPISSLPDRPEVDDTSATWQRLEPITFMGERIPPWPADKEIQPWPVSQDDVSTVDGKLHPESAPAPSSGVTTQAPAAPDSLGGISSAVGAMACLVLSGCAAHERSLLVGFFVGALFTWAVSSLWRRS